MSNDLKTLLNQKYLEFNTPNFIETDPISIPHSFSKLQDIEIMGLWAAVLAWGQRKTIIRSCKRLIEIMGGTPHDFIINHQPSDLRPFEDFKHRTFQPIDALYFVEFFKNWYQKNDSLERAFSNHLTKNDEHIGNALIGFYNTFFNLPNAPHRTRKHIATPIRKSTCKRLCMFLRWMVRDDKNGVDLGIWKKISPAQLLCPLDVHVDRVARKLGLISRKQTDWQTVLELTKNLRKLDPNDPVKYDFALFGMGVGI